VTYRLGLDLGTNSIGWAVIRLDDELATAELLDAGSRIFSDGRNPKDGSSLASRRRMARSARRRRDRGTTRKRLLLNALVRHGLMPGSEADRKALQARDPYAIRAHALNHRVDLHELGRALFHLGQRRGFKSNRRSASDDDGVVRTGISNLQARLDEHRCRTVGEYLHQLKRAGSSVRARRPGPRDEYPFYLSRQLIEDEFLLLCSVQARHHSELTDQVRDDLHRIIFHQRPLKPVDPGVCALDLSQKRAPKALRLTQEFRILQELANLRVEVAGETAYPLTESQFDGAYEKLRWSQKVTFKGLRKQFSLPKESSFNLEASGRAYLDGDKIAAVMGANKRFGKAWRSFDEAFRDSVVDALTGDLSDDELLTLAQEEWDLDADQADQVVRAPLPDGYGKLSQCALERIVPIMRDQRLGYAEAAKLAGYNHSNQGPEKLLQQLPYYGRVLGSHVVGDSGNKDDSEEQRFGRLPNPTVHIGLNQLRKVINAVIRRYGAPKQIVIELARELKMSKKAKERVSKLQANNRQVNDDARAELATLGQKDNGENRMRYRLWLRSAANPLDRCCVYTGEIISLSRLFSAEVEIDHILPFSQTLDNSASNRILCLRRANRHKGNQTPWEAFSGSPEGYNWNAILASVEEHGQYVARRFNEDAITRFSEEGSFLDRHLTDTAYLSRIAREYLCHVCPSNQVWSVPGRLTAMLRGVWGLNSVLGGARGKNRQDHRHHAVDAVVIACTDRSTLQRVSRNAEGARERLLADLEHPWEGFRDEVKAIIGAVLVAHRQDHGTGGALHNDTAYGIVDGPDSNGIYTVVSRKPLSSLKPNQVEQVADPTLRASLHEAVERAGSDNKSWAAELATFTRTHGVRRVRLHERLGNLVLVGNSAGEPYKAYKADGNHCMDALRLPDGKWRGFCFTRYAAAQKGVTPPWKQRWPAARRIFRLHKNDLLEVPEGSNAGLFRIVKMSKESLTLVMHAEAGDLKKRDADGQDSFKYLTTSVGKLGELKARPVRLDVLGARMD